MPRYSGGDPYIDPASGVLKNCLGIIDQATLDQVEAAFVATRSFELTQKPLKGKFDIVHLQAIHHHLFRDVYEWAGELRTVDISKGGHVFAHHAYIRNAATLVFQQLAEEGYLARYQADVFSNRAAYYFGELNAIHPFREGNGRAQREFISHLGYTNGYYIAWENVTREDMLRASIESFRGITNGLATLIRDNLFSF